MCAASWPRRAVTSLFARVFAVSLTHSRHTPSTSCGLRAYLRQLCECASPFHGRSCRVRAAVRRGPRRKDQADDQAVQPEGLRKDEDEYHADVDARLQRDRPHTRVADDADRDAGRHAAQPAAQPGRQVREATRAVVRMASAAEALKGLTPSATMTAMMRP